MSLFFKKRKGNLKTNGFPRSGESYFRGAVQKKHAKIAGWLNRKTSRCSAMQKKIGLAAFCLIFGGFILYFLTESILSGQAGGNKNPVEHLSLPVQLKNLLRVWPLTISPEDFKHMEKANKYLDSLRHNDTVKLKQILISKPRLFEGIMPENISQSQKK